LRKLRHLPARRDASRRCSLPPTKTSPHWLISLGSGLTGCMRGIRPRQSCWTWIPASALPMAIRKDCLQRPLRLHLLPSAVRVQPVRRSGTVHFTARPLCRHDGGQSGSIRVAVQDRCVLRRSNYALTMRSGHRAGSLITKSARSSADHSLS